MEVDRDLPEGEAGWEMGGEGEFVVEEELGWCRGGRQNLGERGAPGIWSVPKCEPLFQRSSGAEQNGQSRARKLGSGRVRRSHIPGSRSRRRRRTLGTSAMLAGAPTGAPGAGCSGMRSSGGTSGMRSSGGTSGTRTGGGTRTATSRGAKAAPGKSGRRGRRLAGGATAVGKMCPPGEADPGSPIPGTGSAALAETPAAAELWVSVWGEGGPEPAQTCSRLPGCHGWTIPPGGFPLPLILPWAGAFHAARAAGWDRGLFFDWGGCQEVEGGSSRMLPFPKSLGQCPPLALGGEAAWCLVWPHGLGLGPVPTWHLLDSTRDLQGCAPVLG